MSRSLEIAAVVGTKSITHEVKQGDMVIVDGITGDVIMIQLKTNSLLIKINVSVSLKIKELQNFVMPKL